jgi:hypothetical protein
MKTKLILAVGIASLVFITGCGSLASEFGATPAAPSTVERVLYNTVTNFVEIPVTVTNTVQATNQVVVTTTNIIGQTVTVTNQVVQVITSTQTVTNVVPVYQLTPSATAGAAVSGITTVGNFIAPGLGTLGGIAATGLLALWGWLRSGKKGATNDVIAQEVETLREFIQALPNGTKYDAAITAWLQAHQVQTGVATQVLSVLENSVDNPAAKVAAQDIIAAITAAGTPVPKA